MLYFYHFNYTMEHFHGSEFGAWDFFAEIFLSGGFGGFDFCPNSILFVTFIMELSPISPTGHLLQLKSEAKISNKAVKKTFSYQYKVVP